MHPLPPARPYPPRQPRGDHLRSPGRRLGRTVLAQEIGKAASREGQTLAARKAAVVAVLEVDPAIDALFAEFDGARAWVAALTEAITAIGPVEGQTLAARKAAVVAVLEVDPAIDALFAEFDGARAWVAALTEAITAIGPVRSPSLDVAGQLVSGSLGPPRLGSVVLIGVRSAANVM